MNNKPDRPSYAVELGKVCPQATGSPDSVAVLLAVLEQDYAVLLIKLSRYLGSPDAAADALHDTYVKLRSYPSVSNLRHPKAYLYRMAINLTLNNRRRDVRTISAANQEFESLPDGTPDPERSALAVKEMEQVFTALHALPSKRREIFLARWRDGKTNEEIATAFGMHKRSIQKDLARTESYLRNIMGRLKSD